MKATDYVDVEGRRLALTNLDKILYPACSFTKAHVIDYYLRVAKWLLPHYRNRPITLQRFPDGVRGKSFYEKDAPKYTPEWVHTTLVPRSAGGDPIRYICVDDVPTLVWCANVASLELHAFLHRAGTLNRPTSLVFDLDPGEGTDLVTCAEVALQLKAMLDDRGLRCWPKVSGSKGLQMYVPLNTEVTYEETRAFAEKIARSLEREHPKLVVAEMTKALRRGKVFIDWSQNSDFKTTIGVYSLRAKSDSPFVSAPVTWMELESLKRSDAEKLRFSPAALLERTSKIGDLFAEVPTLQQTLAAGANARATKIARPGAVQKPAGVKAQDRRPEPGIAGSAAKFIEPMLLLPTPNLPDGKEWLYELKLDGYRALAHKANGQVLLRSRNDNDFATRFALIARALKNLPDETIVDGEVVALDAKGKPSFNLLQNHGSSTPSLIFYAFDLLMLREKDLTQEPLTKRRELLLSDALKDLGEPIRFSPTLDAGLPDLIRSVKAQGLEGLIAKRRNSIYEPGERSGAWQKMRINQGQELVIGGYTPGSHGFDALVIGYFDNGKLMYAARTRNGFTPVLRSQIFERLKKLEIETCPFANLPEKTPGRWGQGLTAEKMKECRWLKPVTVAQFEFVEWTPENHLRHSKFVALRDDKSAADVTRTL